MVVQWLFNIPNLYVELHLNPTSVKEVSLLVDMIATVAQCILRCP